MKKADQTLKGKATEAVGGAAFVSISRHLIKLAQLGMLSLPLFAHADFTGKVVAVADGDTITVLRGQEQVKVRLSGIDAPERKQPYGERARQSMINLVFGKQVFVEERKLDRYGRTVGLVRVAPNDCKKSDCAKTLDSSMAMLTTGLAWHYKRFEAEQPEEERGQYSFAEDEARAKKAGLWRDSNPVAPWDWRAEKKASEEKRG